MRSALFALLAAGALGGCAYIVPPDLYRSGQIGPAPPSEPADTAELRVMIYNVEGLAWPARSGRSPRLRMIGERLARMNREGRAPHVLLVQEAFSPAAIRMIRASGYRTAVPGPDREARRSLPGEASREFRNGRRLVKGEGIAPLLHSGLYVLSNLPVTEVRSEPFSRRACAGYDCLANKAVMMARVAVPGFSVPVDIYTVHFNSNGASGVSRERSNAAHRFQLRESAAFVEATRNPEAAMIFAGDFNMRRSEERHRRFAFKKPYPFARQYCVEEKGRCDIRMSFDGDEPWMDTQDLHAFDSGSRQQLVPIRIEAMFDDPVGGRPLADHDAYLVTYRLSRRP